jgi:glycerophosphoryl diester phosphodiesterase
LLIAHRAGNDAKRTRAAEQAGADMIEADLQLRRGRLELRHLKTVGRLPLYWDRWALAPPWRHFDDVADLLERAQPQTALMLDLKGDDPAAARLLSQILIRHPRAAPVVVSARAWALLGEIDPALAQRIGSAARPPELDGLIAYATTHAIDGASLHLRLLEPGRLQALRQHAPLVMTWPVNRRDQAERATALGIAGLISDNLALLAALRSERGLREAPAGAQGVAQGERAEGHQQREQADGDVDEGHAQLHADAVADDAGRRGRLA